MTQIGHNTSYIQILPYGAATSVGAFFVFFGVNDEYLPSCINCHALISFVQHENGGAYDALKYAKFKGIEIII